MGSGPPINKNLFTQRFFESLLNLSSVFREKDINEKLNIRRTATTAITKDPGHFDPLSSLDPSAQVSLNPNIASHWLSKEDTLIHEHLISPNFDTVLFYSFSSK